MSGSKNDGDVDERNSPHISVILKTVKSQSSAPLSEDGVGSSSSPTSMYGVGAGTSSSQKFFCCTQLFQSVKSFKLHLLEKASSDKQHERRLNNMGMQKCGLCSVWLEKSGMTQHLKTKHNIIKTIPSGQTVSNVSSNGTASKEIAATTMQSGKSYVIKVSGQSFKSGQPFMIRHPMSRPITSVINNSGVANTMPPFKLMTTSGGNVKVIPNINLQQSPANSKKIVVRPAGANSSIPGMSMGPRLIMKGSSKDGSSGSGICKILPGNREILQDGSSLGKNVNGINKMQIINGGIIASGSSDHLPNKKTPHKVNNPESTVLKKSSKASNKQTSGKLNPIKSPGGSPCVRFSSPGKPIKITNFSNAESNISKAGSLKTDLNTSTANSDTTDEDLARAEKKMMKALLIKEKLAKIKQQNSKKTVSDIADDKQSIDSKKEVAKGKKSSGKPPTASKQNKPKNKPDKIKLKNDVSGPLVSDQDKVKDPVTPRDVLKSDAKISAGSSTTPQSRKKRKQALKPMTESDPSPNLPKPFTSKVKGRRKGKNVSEDEEYTNPKVSKKTSPRLAVNHKKYSKRLKENKCDTFKPTPKTSRNTGGRGLRGNLRAKRPVGRPRREPSVEKGTPDLSELGTLFDSADNEDLENDPLLAKAKDDENIPTVELEMFTLPSLNEQVSVLLTDPHNPDFKVYSSMDAIFVGDSALGDVTNQIGYVTDANNVVFVNPGHFLFPNIKELDKFVPKPILTMKEKKLLSPKKISKLNSSMCYKENHFGKRHSSKMHESQCIETTPVKSPLSSQDVCGGRVRRRSSRRSGDKSESEHDEPTPRKSTPSKSSAFAMSSSSDVCSKKELKVIISPIKEEYQSLLDDLLEKHRKSPSKNKVNLSFDVSSSKTDTAGLPSCDSQTGVSGAAVSVSEDIPDLPVNERPRTRTRSAETAKSIEPLIVPSEDSCRNHLLRRKGRLKSESESAVSRTRNISSKDSSLTTTEVSRDHNKGVKMTCDKEDTAKSSTAEESDKLVGNLAENSVISGKNSTITNMASNLLRNRPTRERKPSCRWLESLALERRPRKLSSPKLRTERAVSDTTSQSSFVKETSLFEPEAELSSLDITRLRGKLKMTEKSEHIDTSTTKDSVVPDQIHTRIIESKSLDLEDTDCADVSNVLETSVDQDLTSDTNQENVATNLSNENESKDELKPNIDLAEIIEQCLGSDLDNIEIGKSDFDNTSLSDFEKSCLGTNSAGVVCNMESVMSSDVSVNPMDIIQGEVYKNDTEQSEANQYDTEQFEMNEKNNIHSEGNLKENILDTALMEVIHDSTTESEVCNTLQTETNQNDKMQTEDNVIDTAESEGNQDASQSGVSVKDDSKGEMNQNEASHSGVNLKYGSQSEMNLNNASHSGGNLKDTSHSEVNLQESQSSVTDAISSPENGKTLIKSPLSSPGKNGSPKRRLVRNTIETILGSPEKVTPVKCVETVDVGKDPSKETLPSIVGAVKSDSMNEKNDTFSEELEEKPDVKEIVPNMSLKASGNQSSNNDTTTILIDTDINTKNMCQLLKEVEETSIREIEKAKTVDSIDNAVEIDEDDSPETNEELKKIETTTEQTESDEVQEEKVIKSENVFRIEKAESSTVVDDDTRVTPEYSKVKKPEVSESKVTEKVCDIKKDKKRKSKKSSLTNEQKIEVETNKVKDSRVSNADEDTEVKKVKGCKLRRTSITDEAKTKISSNVDKPDDSIDVEKSEVVGEVTKTEADEVTKTEADEVTKTGEIKVNITDETKEVKKTERSSKLRSSLTNDEKPEDSSIHKNLKTSEVKKTNKDTEKQIKENINEVRKTKAITEVITEHAGISCKPRRPSVVHDQVKTGKESEVKKESDSQGNNTEREIETKKTESSKNKNSESKSIHEEKTENSSEVMKIDISKETNLDNANNIKAKEISNELALENTNVMEIANLRTDETIVEKKTEVILKETEKSSEEHKSSKLKVGKKEKDKKKRKEDKTDTDDVKKTAEVKETTHQQPEKSDVGKRKNIKAEAAAENVSGALPKPEPENDDDTKISAMAKDEISVPKPEPLSQSKRRGRSRKSLDDTEINMAGELVKKIDFNSDKTDTNEVMPSDDTEIVRSDVKSDSALIEESSFEMASERESKPETEEKPKLDISSRDDSLNVQLAKEIVCSETDNIIDGDQGPSEPKKRGRKKKKKTLNKEKLMKEEMEKEKHNSTDISSVPKVDERRLKEELKITKSKLTELSSQDASSSESKERVDDISMEETKTNTQCVDSNTIDGVGRVTTNQIDKKRSQINSETETTQSTGSNDEKIVSVLSPSREDNSQESISDVSSPNTFKTPNRSSPTKDSPELSPSRLWLGRGAKLKAQVLIQDQQTGVTDSHVLSPSQDDKKIMEAIRSLTSPETPPRKGKMDSTFVLGSPPRKVDSTPTTVSSRDEIPRKSKIFSSPKEADESPNKAKTPKSSKSPMSSPDDREWQARGAKLRAQIMITDQQTGQTNTSVNVAANMYSPPHRSPPYKKIKLEPSPRNMKDIRSFFTVTKSPEQSVRRPTGEVTPKASRSCKDYPQSTDTINASSPTISKPGSSSLSISKPEISSQMISKSEISSPSTSKVDVSFPTSKIKNSSPLISSFVESESSTLSISESETCSSLNSNSSRKCNSSSERSETELPVRIRVDYSSSETASNAKPSLNEHSLDNDDSSKPDAVSMSSSVCSPLGAETPNTFSTTSDSSSKFRKPCVDSSTMSSPQSDSSFKISSPSITSCIKRSPLSTRRKKLKLNVGTNSDIRTFFSPVRNPKRKRESSPSAEDLCKAVKTDTKEEVVTATSSVILPKTDQTDDVCPAPQTTCKLSKKASKIHRWLSDSKCASDDFEGFAYSSRMSAQRVSTLTRTMSLLENKCGMGLDKFPFPIDQLCDWDSELLDNRIFDKYS